MAFALLPDVAVFYGLAPGLERGQLHPRAVGPYNALHRFAGPAVVGVAAVWLGWPWVAAALAWAAHVAVDRAIGLRPRDRAGFQRAPASGDGAAQDGSGKDRPPGGLGRRRSTTSGSSVPSRAIQPPAQVARR